MAEHLIRTMSGQITARIREKIITGAYPPAEVSCLTHAHIETTREDLARLLQPPK